MSELASTVVGKKTPQCGIAPAIALVNPKTAANVGMVVRLASCYGIKQVWWTGNRVAMDLDGKSRLPREERMRGYMSVDMYQHDYFFDMFDMSVVTPVAVEVSNDFENLLQFEHPKNALYVFGPEDGSIRGVHYRHCHRFIQIPVAHCLNLATAVATVLWDRRLKTYNSGAVHLITISPGEVEERGFQEDFSFLKDKMT